MLQNRPPAPHAASQPARSRGNLSPFRCESSCSTVSPPTRAPPAGKVYPTWGMWCCTRARGRGSCWNAPPAPTRSSRTRWSWTPGPWASCRSCATSASVPRAPTWSICRRPAARNRGHQRARVRGGIRRPDGVRGGAALRRRSRRPQRRRQIGRLGPQSRLLLLPQAAVRAGRQAAGHPGPGGHRQRGGRHRRAASAWRCWPRRYRAAPRAPTGSTWARSCHARIRHPALPADPGHRTHGRRRLPGPAAGPRGADQHQPRGSHRRTSAAGQPARGPPGRRGPGRAGPGTPAPRSPADRPARPLRRSPAGHAPPGLGHGRGPRPPARRGHREPRRLPAQRPPQPGRLDPSRGTRRSTARRRTARSR